jgi:hypothetical protein
MNYDDRCTGSADGEHTWVPVNGGADCSSCSASTAFPTRGGR